MNDSSDLKVLIFLAIALSWIFGFLCGKDFGRKDATEGKDVKPQKDDS